MKEILERIGLSEFFAYIFPGAILLASFALWVPLNFDETFWKQEILVITLGLIFSYVLGLVLSSFNDRAFMRYQRSAHRTTGGKLGKLWARMVALTYWIPSPRFTRAIVESDLKIAEGLERLSGQPGLSQIASPWDRLIVYRTLVSDQAGENAKPLLVEADVLHRRFRFSMGVALAIFIVSIQLFLKLAVQLVLRFTSLESNTPSNINLIALIAGAMFALWISLELRQVAIRTWELERYLTASLTGASHVEGAEIDPAFE